MDADDVELDLLFAWAVAALRPVADRLVRRRFLGAIFTPRGNETLGRCTLGAGSQRIVGSVFPTISPINSPKGIGNVDVGDDALTWMIATCTCGS